MILMHLYYQGKPGQAKEFAREMIESGLVEKIRNELGNLQYEYFIPFDREDTILLVDRWENQEALDYHHQLDIMDQISALRNKYDLHMEAQSYQDASISSHDQQFIRK